MKPHDNDKARAYANYLGRYYLGLQHEAEENPEVKKALERLEQILDASAAIDSPTKEWFFVQELAGLPRKLAA